MTHNEMFEKCTESGPIFESKWEIRCKLGNWCVIAPSLKEADREAKHYWGQYFSDGEYDQMLYINNSQPTT